MNDTKDRKDSTKSTMNTERLVKRTVQFCLNIIKNGLVIPRKLDSVEAINLSMTELEPVLKGVEALEYVAQDGKEESIVKFVTDEDNHLD